MSGFALGQHLLKLIAGGRLCAADASVGKHAGVLPARRFLYECTVITDLLIQRMKQSLRRHGDAGVGGYTLFCRVRDLLLFNFPYDLRHWTVPPFSDIIVKGIVDTQGTQRV